MADETSPIWHLAKGDQKIGVFTSQLLAEMGLQGRITSDMKVWKWGMQAWQPVSKVKGLRVTFVPKEPPPIDATPTQSCDSRNHVTIEKTSKPLKAGWLVALVAMVCGLAFVLIGAWLGHLAYGDLYVHNHSPALGWLGKIMSVSGWLLLMAGIPMWIAMRIGIWWHHG
jgi:hypothetical protein